MKLGSDDATERFRAELRAWQKRLFDAG